VLKSIAPASSVLVSSHSKKVTVVNLIKRASSLFLLIVVALSFRFPCNAAVINAVSCLFSDVSAAVALASPGDTVQLPAGTNWWSQTINLNGVSIKGAGTNATVLIDEVPRTGTGGQLFYINGTGSSYTEISNLQLRCGVTNTSYNYNGSIACNGVPTSSWRVDHVTFNSLYAKSILTYGSPECCVDHNTFMLMAQGVAIGNWGGGYGDYSYSVPPTYGINSTNVLYVENNYFTNETGLLEVSDGDGGGRIVFRYNTIWNAYFNNHGTETGGRVRSERSFEIYCNNFNVSPSYGSIFAAVCIRGGSGVIYSNTCNGAYNELVALRDFRSTQAYSGQWYPFGGANGINPWDSNNPTLYLSGVNSSANGSSYLQVNGANWTPNQWIGYTLLDTNNGLFSVVTSNTSNQMDYIGSDQASASLVNGTVMTLNNGDHFQLYMVDATLDQPGRGSGNLLEDNGVTANDYEVVINAMTNTVSWPNEALESIYCWGNTINGTIANLSSPYPNLQQNRDFYNSSMPGYTPLVYPHPLDLSTNSGLQPPSNLKIAGNIN
jgi:hypothetical protein